jgi:murein DD-endopeptidase MepM/ murein hydrolase activator NlpD
MLFADARRAYARGWRRLRVAALGVVLVAVALPAYADPSEPPPASVTDVSRSLEQLQAEAASLQADFAKATIAYTNALKATQQANAAADLAERNAVTAKAKAANERRRLGVLSAQAYQLGIPTTIGTESMLWSLAAVAENLQEIADRQTAIKTVGDTQVAQYRTAMDAEGAATTAVTDAATKRAAADKAASTAKTLSEQVRKKAADAAAVMQGRLADLTGSTQVSEQAQQTRNKDALSRWKTYLAELTAAGVVAPKASTLRNPAKLPAGLKPLADTSGKPVRGAAAVVDGGRTVRVLPAETIRAVNTAFSLLGKPYGVGATGPDSYGCLGAARAAWEPYTTLLRRVDKVYPQYQKVTTASVQPGDLLVMGNETVGLYHIGVALGDGEMIAADEARGAVIVTSVPASLYAALRPTLGAPATRQVAPAATSEAYAFRCGNSTTSYAVDNGAWVWPLAEGTYEIGTPFGQPGALWSTGYHTGQDFPAAIGTPVRAVTDGTAHIEHPAWAGNLVRIDHGNGLETLYAHLSAIDITDGAKVAAGQRIGAVGNEGNSTGPHLHFEVRLGGDPVNPMTFLATGSTSLGWGGFSNGLIPASKLCSITAGHMLRCDAATAYQRLASSFKAKFGRKLCITDSYRSYASQVDLYARKPSLAALPGTSNHGWGVAVDLCGGIQSFGTTEYKWMEAHAGAYGWVHPAWARQGGTRQEPWHWEFGQPASS